MSSNEYSHLNDLSQLRFLVIDEADRMIKQGSFPQLKQIFEVINRANPPPSNAVEDDESDDTSDFVVAIKKMFSVDGGVTSEYVKNTIEFWAGMLLHPVYFFEGTNSEAE